MTVFPAYTMKTAKAPHSVPSLLKAGDQFTLRALNNWKMNHRYPVNRRLCGPHSGPGSAVGIATDYGLDGPGIESQWRRDFPYLSRPVLGPNQPHVQWVPGFSRG